eukprot:scaffold1410_cov242-Pinguiococcus_pyrenoidosus.AAC.13
MAEVDSAAPRRRLCSALRSWSVATSPMTADSIDAGGAAIAHDGRRLTFVHEGVCISDRHAVGDEHCILPPDEAAGNLHCRDLVQRASGLRSVLLQRPGHQALNFQVKVLQHVEIRAHFQRGARRRGNGPDEGPNWAVKGMRDEIVRIPSLSRARGVNENVRKLRRVGRRLLDVRVHRGGYQRSAELDDNLRQNVVQDQRMAEHVRVGLHRLGGGPQGARRLGLIRAKSARHYHPSLGALDELHDVSQALLPENVGLLRLAVGCVGLHTLSPLIRPRTGQPQVGIPSCTLRGQAPGPRVTADGTADRSKVLAEREVHVDRTAKLDGALHRVIDVAEKRRQGHFFVGGAQGTLPANVGTEYPRLHDRLIGAVVYRFDGSIGRQDKHREAVIRRLHNAGE